LPLQNGYPTYPVKFYLLIGYQMFRSDKSTNSIITWQIMPGLSAYRDTVTKMEALVDDIIVHKSPEAVWLLEHPPLYTMGTSAQKEDVLDSTLPVFETGRGGQVTYHGPGQRIAYVMLDLRQRQQDLRAYIHQLEAWLIATLKDFDIRGRVYPERVGVWVTDLQGQESKIAAIGVRVRKWVTYHGLAFNVAPDLSHYDGIVPCGIRTYGVTSLAELGLNITIAEADTILQKNFSHFF
jgi:lipoyl(octanoyl) transferase